MDTFVAVVCADQNQVAPSGSLFCRRPVDAGVACRGEHADEIGCITDIIDQHIGAICLHKVKLVANGDIRAFFAHLRDELARDGGFEHIVAALRDCQNAGAVAQTRRKELCHLGGDLRGVLGNARLLAKALHFARNAVQRDDRDAALRKAVERSRLCQPRDETVDLLIRQLAHCPEIFIIIIALDAGDLRLIAHLLDHIQKARAHDAQRRVIFEVEHDDKLFLRGVKFWGGGADAVADGVIRDEDVNVLVRWDGVHDEPPKLLLDSGIVESDVREGEIRVLRADAVRHGGDGHILRHADVKRAQAVDDLDRCAVGCADDGGDIEVADNIRDVRPDMRVALEVHDDLRRVER